MIIWVHERVSPENFSCDNRTFHLYITIITWKSRKDYVANWVGCDPLLFSLGSPCFWYSVYFRNILAEGVYPHPNPCAQYALWLLFFIKEYYFVICFLVTSNHPFQTTEFWREAEILSKLHHPNVVAFYGVVQDGPGGTLATVTEFMVNGSLRHVLISKER